MNTSPPPTEWLLVWLLQRESLDQDMIQRGEDFEGKLSKARVHEAAPVPPLAVWL